MACWHPALVVRDPRCYDAICVNAMRAPRREFIPIEGGGHFAVVLLVLGVTLAGACAERGETGIRAEFDAYVRARNACLTVFDCTLNHFECPLPCFVAANVAHSEAIRAMAVDLIEENESAGRGCTYRCASPPELECRAGHCFPEP
jgi:hypothetical protein